MKGVNLGYIDTQKYTILLKQNERDFADYEKILGRYFKKSDKAKIFIYVGEYDEYALDDGQQQTVFEKYIVTNIADGTFSKIMYYSPEQKCLSEFKKS